MSCKHGLLIFLIILASGCASQEPLSAGMAAWQGEDVSVALETWGAPEDARAFGDETILLWRDRASFHSPSGRLSERAEAVVLCERMLAVADDGTITGWRWRGNACETIAEIVAPAERERTLAAAR